MALGDGANQIIHPIRPPLVPFLPKAFDVGIGYDHKPMQIRRQLLFFLFPVFLHAGIVAEITILPALPARVLLAVDTSFRLFHFRSFIAIRTLLWIPSTNFKTRSNSSLASMPSLMAAITFPISIPPFKSISV